MSAFRVGDRVKNGTISWSDTGTVTSVNPDGSRTVRWDNGCSAPYATAELMLVGRVNPSIGDLVHPSGAKVEAGPAFTLDTATGSALDAIARDRFMTHRARGETDAALVIRCRSIRATSHVNITAPVHPADCSCATQSEWSEALAQLNEKHKALDTVRKFLGAHSFASCSLACNRELREVMAVVLKALDAGKAGK